MMAPPTEEEGDIRSTLESLDGLGLTQLTSVDVCTSIIAGDMQDYADTTDLPSAQASGYKCLVWFEAHLPSS